MIKSFSWGTPNQTSVSLTVDEEVFIFANARYIRVNFSCWTSNHDPPNSRNCKLYECAAWEL